MGANPHDILVVQSLSSIQFFATPWTTTRQASLSFTISQNLLKLTSVESVMPSIWLRRGNLDTDTHSEDAMKTEEEMAVYKPGQEALRRNQPGPNLCLQLSFLKIYLFGCAGLSCSTWDLLFCGVRDLKLWQVNLSSMWGQLLWPGVKPRVPCLSVGSTES